MAGIASNRTRPPSGRSAGDPSYHTLTGLGVGVTVVAALYFGKDILLPITVAVLLSFVLSPLVGTLRRLRIPRAVAWCSLWDSRSRLLAEWEHCSVARSLKWPEICRYIRPRSRRRSISCAALLSDALHVGS